MRAQLQPNADRFAALLDDDGRLAVASLVAACAQDDVALATVPDEVLVLCGHDAAASPRPHWTPWLLRDDVDVEAARADAAAALRDQGLLEIDADDRPVLHQPLATLAWVLQSTTGLVTYETEVRGEGRESGGVFVLPHGLVLHDHIDPEQGVHRLVFRDVEVEAAWLAGFLDPAGCSRRTLSPRTAGSLAELEPQIQRLPGRHRSRAVMAASGRIEDVPRELAVTAFGTTRGVWFLQARTGGTPAAALQQVGESDVLAVARAVLAIAEGGASSP